MKQMMTQSYGWNQQRPQHLWNEMNLANMCWVTFPVVWNHFSRLMRCFPSLLNSEVKSAYSSVVSWDVFRHYSTVKSSLLTAVLPVCLLSIYINFSSHDSRYLLAVLLTQFGLCSAAAHTEGESANWGIYCDLYLYYFYFILYIIVFFTYLWWHCLHVTLSSWCQWWRWHRGAFRDLN